MIKQLESEKMTMGYKSGDRAEFGIIDVIDPARNYGTSYEPERYGCIAVCDDTVEDWWDGLKDMKSYFHCMSRPETAHARYGVTLIPPESLEQLIDVMRTKTRDEFKTDTFEIIDLLIRARLQGKYVIHYGI